MNATERRLVRKALKHLDDCVNGFQGDFALIDVRICLEKLLGVDA
jgi:hypothetical protein